MTSRFILAIPLLALLSCVPAADELVSGRPTPAILTPAQLNPPTVWADGLFRPITQSLESIGHLVPGDEADIRVSSAASPSVFVLDTLGRMIDAAEDVGRLTFVADREDDYFILFSTSSQNTWKGKVSLRVRHDQPIVQRTPQVFLVSFDRAPSVKLSDGRTFCDLAPMDLRAFADSNDAQKRQEQEELLVRIEPLVKEYIVKRLRNVLEPYGMTVFDDPNKVADGPFSTVYFTNTVGPVWTGDDLWDTTVAPGQDPNSSNPQLILYGTAGGDPGNRIHDDDAIVFVGSFIGQPLLKASVNDMVNILAHTAAHEMGHLVGLQHVYRTSDIMWGRPSYAYPRDIDFGMAQVVFGTSLVEYMYQDPNRYLRRINGLD